MGIQLNTCGPTPGAKAQVARATPTMCGATTVPVARRALTHAHL
jgi:hypothetical protein